MASVAGGEDLPSKAVAVAERYHRFERVVSTTVAVLVGVAGATALVVFPFVRGLFVALALLVAVRLPLYRMSGRVRLVTDDGPEEVRTAFESPTPPPLAFQWGVADTVRATADGGTHEVSYLFGLRSVTMEAAVRPGQSDGDFGLVVTAEDRSWATYDVSIRDEDGRTVVDVEWGSDRRFGLRRLPQHLVAKRYRDEALAAQGYTVVERTGSLHR